MNNCKPNNIIIEYPDLAAEWDYEKNVGLVPEMVTKGSSKKIWWKCPICHGSYKSTVYHRTSGKDCPYCAGRKILYGFNDLKTSYPKLAKEWDYDKNEGLTPKMVTSGSNKKVWWKCPICHGSYKSTIANRVIGTSCPYCAGQKVLVGVNDLLSQYPTLCEEWDYDKNGELTPDKVTTGSGKKVWWKCPNCNGQYQAIVNSRTRGTSCPYCAGQKVLVGVNDLLSQYPTLCEEWDYDKNGELTPDKVTTGTTMKVWWKCSRCGHEWKTGISHRVNGTACPNCATRQTSFAEQAAFYYVKRYFPDAVDRDQTYGFELDIFIPTIKTGIEYDGVYFHSENKKGMSDNEKELLCAKNGIHLIRIREKGLPKTSCAVNIFRLSSSDSGLNDSISSLLKELGVDNFQLPDVSKDMPYIHSQYTESYKKDSLAKKIPELLEEWNYSKNGNLTPEQINAGSHKKLWWKCAKCEHEWQTSAYNRSKGHGCPLCAARKISESLKKYDKKSFMHIINKISPDIKIIGDYTDVSTKVRCRCKKCKYEWDAYPTNLLRGTGCRRCKSKIRGHNQAKTAEQFKKELQERNSNLEVIGEYKTNSTKLEIRCRKCKKHFSRTPSQMLKIPKCRFCDK